MRIGEIYKVRLTLNRWFLLLVALFGASGMLKEVFAAFFSVLLHEASHAYVATKLGYRVREIELMPFGGVARIERLEGSGPKDAALIAAAGPLCSFFIAGACFAAGPPRPDTFMDLIVQVNLMLGLFNLLPAYPLDGGRILHALFQCVMRHKRATKYVVYLSYALCAAMAGKILFDVWTQQVVNFSLGVIAGFVLVSAKRESQGLDFHAVRIMAYKKADLARKGFMETQHYTVAKHMAIKTLVRQFKTERYAVILIVDERHHVCGSVTEIELWDALIKRGLSARFGDLL